MEKVIEQKRNKQDIILVFLLGIFMFACGGILLVYVYFNNHPMAAYAQNKNMIISKAPFFYGVSMDMSQILPASEHYIVNSQGQDLIDIAAKLGVNMIRITNAERSFDNNKDSLYTKTQWDTVLNKMEHLKIKADILIETASNNGDYYTRNINSIYLNLVQSYVDSGVFAHADVFSVDIKNEPILTPSNIAIMKQAAYMIKSKYHNLPITVGWWGTDTNTKDSSGNEIYNWENFKAGAQLESIVDFYSLHMYDVDTKTLGFYYNPSLKTKLFIGNAEVGLQTKKPILIEEFGEANGDAVSDQDTIGNPELQANIYQGVYSALNQMNDTQILGSIAFDIHTKTQYPDAWAITKNNGNYLFPAALILKEFATHKMDPLLQASTVVTTNSSVFTNADNNSSQSINLSDRIGFEFQLDNTKNNTITFSNSASVKNIEQFHYDSDHSYYVVVYQAIAKGNTTLSVQSNGEEVYHMSIAIH